MKKALVLAILMGTSFVASPCTLEWDYADSSWLEGFRVYQGGARVGEAAPANRSGDCSTLGLVPGPGPITMTAYRGADESPQSDPAVFELTRPGRPVVRISVGRGMMK